MITATNQLIGTITAVHSLFVRGFGFRADVRAEIGGGIMDVFESELIKIKRRLRLPCEIATPGLFTYLYGYGLRPKRGSCAIC